jgi:hypothetical protein
MIQYVELIPTKDAAKVGCKVEVEVPFNGKPLKVMVKNNSHIRLYYSTPLEVLSLSKVTFFLAPTGVECPEILEDNCKYIDSVELFSDTVVFHIYRLY